MFFKKNLKSNIDFLIVGLGNPGMQYEKTRHNAGFAVIDKLCDELSISPFKHKFKSLITESSIAGKRVLIAKPETYMNLSGSAVGEISSFYKIPPENILVVYDDISLPAGKLRIRAKGSAGGHNGIKDIIAVLGSENFPRVKVGVGEKPHPDFDLKDWVLSKMSKEEREKFDEAVKKAVQAICLIIQSGDTAEAMNKYNG